MSVYAKPLMDLIHLWYDGRYWSKILCSTIPFPVHELKVQIRDLEFFF